MAESRFTTSQDGLRLHTLEYGDRHSPRLPVVCLPGLSRTAEDFTTLAMALAADRRVLALDYRGRGRSDYDPNPENYAIDVEAADVMTVMAALEAAPAIVVGTSRGGLIAMTMRWLPKKEWRRSSNRSGVSAVKGKFDRKRLTKGLQAESKYG